MRRKIRKVFGNAPTHAYQLSDDRGIIFYETVDFLVFYTIFSVISIQYNIVVIGLCIMLNHIHSLFYAGSKEILTSFVRHYTILFAKEYNAEHSRKGRLFSSPFGSAPKVGEKNVRTTIAYLYNNPVEKKLCDVAKKYRWNFLAYANDVNPFSKKLALRKASRPYRTAIDTVRYYRAKNEHLTYQVLRKIFNTLTPEEEERFIDYVVTIYNPINYKKAVSFYGDPEKMELAINSNTGSEYDIKEDFNRHPDSIFQKIKLSFIKSYPDISLKSIQALPLRQKFEIEHTLYEATYVDLLQIDLFLHIDTNPS